MRLEPVLAAVMYTGLWRYSFLVALRGAKVL